MSVLEVVTPPGSPGPANRPSLPAPGRAEVEGEDGDSEMPSMPVTAAEGARAVPPPLEFYEAKKAYLEQVAGTEEAAVLLGADRVGEEKVVGGVGHEGPPAAAVVLGGLDVSSSFFFGSGGCGAMDGVYGGGEFSEEFESMMSL